MIQKKIFGYILVILIMAGSLTLLHWRNESAFSKASGMTQDTAVADDRNTTGSSVSGGAVTGQSVSGQSVSGQFVSAQAAAKSVFVDTTSGRIKGKKTKKAYIWLGVPYGQTERWQQPKAPDPWVNTRSCLKAKKGKGDDCLFVNVYKPRVESGQKIPVMVFLHGGGNTGGSANKSFSAFVEETKVMVVSVEFRQGAFGWFNSRGLQTGNRLTDGGNFAMMDIKLALEWVRDNAEAFGGDNMNVTLSGFSAGARDALNCVISPQMGGLFHKAVSFSGGMTTCSVKEGRKWSNNKLAQVLVRRGRFAKKNRALRSIKNMSRKKLKKLLDSLTDGEIKRMTKNTSLRLTNFPQCFRDGKWIPKDGFDCMEYGAYNRVPMIIGSNNSEFANMSYNAMRRILVRSPRTFKNRRQFYSLLKKAKEYGSKLQSSFYLEKVAAKVSYDDYHRDIYTYRFQWGESSGIVGKNHAAYVGAIHGMDVDFLLGRYKKGEEATSAKIYRKDNLAGRQELTGVMRQYMKNFFYTGNPNGTWEDGKPLKEWKKWRRVAGSSRIMTFNATKKRAVVKMTSKYIDRTKVKQQMKKRLSKKTYQFLKNRIFYERFFM